MKCVKKNKIFKTLIILILLVGTVSIITMIILKYYNDNIEKNLKIMINGESNITIDYGNQYEDLGAKAWFKDYDLSNKVTKTTDLNLKKIGIYNEIYTITYKKHTKNAKRKIEVIDGKPPVIELKGKKEINIYQNEKYKEEGVISIDNYDGDISDKVVIDGEVDITKIGEYSIKYTSKDSNNNYSSIIRKINVIKKPVYEQKIAVLNYHFFYENWDENCHEAICENMSKFRQHLEYLNNNGFKTLTIKEFVLWMYNKIDLPEKSVLITIDDGAHGTGVHNGNHLIPALEKYNINATLFLITGWWGINNYKSERLDVQSHTNDLHFEVNCGYRSKVNCVSYDDILKDLKESIKITNSTEAFCFPYYEYSETSIKAVKDAGFKVAFVGGNRKASRNDNKYKIPRYVILNSTTLSEFINMVN